MERCFYNMEKSCAKPALLSRSSCPKERWLQSALRERPQYNTSGSTSRSSTQQLAAPAAAPRARPVGAPSIQMSKFLQKPFLELGPKEVRNDLRTRSDWGAQETLKVSRTLLPMPLKKHVKARLASTYPACERAWLEWWHQQPHSSNLSTSQHLTSPAIRREHECITASALQRCFQQTLLRTRSIS